MERRQAEVDRALDVLGLTGTTVLLTHKVKYAVCNTIIKINPNLPDREFTITLSHELLHELGIPHCDCTRRAGYSSKSLEKDVLSASFSKTIQELVMQTRVNLAEKKIAEGQIGFSTGE